MLRHNVIYVDTICPCGLHGWSSDSHQSNLSFKSQSFLSQCSYKGACISAFAPSCFHHHGDYISAEKNSPPPPILLCYEMGDLLCVYHLVYSYFEKGCRIKCTRQTRKVLWVVLSSLFFKEI